VLLEPLVDTLLMEPPALGALFGGCSAWAGAVK